MIEGSVTSYVKQQNKVIVYLSNGKSIEYENAELYITKKRINFIRAIFSLIFFSLISFSIIYYLPPWKLYGLKPGIQFAFSLALFAILVASLYSIYISADSLRKYPILIIKLNGEIHEYLLLSKYKNQESKG
ncbi:hypothetical protein Calag_1011 [Caldisphaera lagunensis DSM 15908]|uniref:Uncharacterized protein n=1 Tax=Caldisphaera lagunensis (strain DSM 15908 / JCM 11604 / ANMR 0165 / IC-154) TaxID=1056495 RepID=L0AA06_CALLD|nr:hypothetical protein Calag_1011 [Caldisphaera lagunensis DSM 15908]